MPISLFPYTVTKCALTMEKVHMRSVLVVAAGMVTFISMCLLCWSLGFLELRRSRHAPSPQAYPLVESASTAIVEEDDTFLWHPRLPKALIIGFSDCGTETASELLALHPDVMLAAGDTRYWSENYYHSLGWYQKLMPNTTGLHVPMEETPGSILSTLSILRMRKAQPNLRLVVVVKSPVLRLLSLQRHSNLSLDTSFPDTVTSLRLEGMLQALSNMYQTYQARLAIVFRIFPQDQVLVVDIEAIKKNPLEFMAEAEKFLALGPGFPKELLVYTKDGTSACFNTSNPLFLAVANRFHFPGNNGCLIEDQAQGLDIDDSHREDFQAFHRPLRQGLYLYLEKEFDWKLI